MMELNYGSKKGFKPVYLVLVVLACMAACGIIAIVMVNRTIAKRPLSSESTHTDATGEPKFWGGYRPTVEYTIQKDVFVFSSSGKNLRLFGPEQNTLLSSKTGQNCITPSIRQYQEKPEKWPFLIGVIRAGTKIRVNSFDLYSTTEYSTVLVHAQVLSGDFKGKDVEIDGISKIDADSVSYLPDTQFLK